MNRLIRFLFALTVCLLSMPTFAVAASVNIQNFLFSPNVLTINLGDSVKWLNKADITHSITQDSNLWTHDANPGSSFTRQFTTEGSYSYHCRFHPSMTGKIVVRNAEQTRIKIGQDIVTVIPKVLPITLNLKGKIANTVYLGSYIVNAQSGCANCHSCPTYAVGHNPYKKEVKQFNARTYLAGGVSVKGVVSANLTPDKTGKPAGLTLDQFKTLLRTGHDPDVPGQLLPVMPWPFFGMMSDHDLDAIYSYLSSIPKAVTPTKACVLGQ
jgi:plastocyanin